VGGDGGGSSCSTCCWGCADEEPDPELLAFEVRREDLCEYVVRSGGLVVKD
jgi:hypothetical protein